MLLVGVSLLYGGLQFVHGQRTADEIIAENLLGETWYKIELDAQHVGYMHNLAYRDHRGRWHFDSTTHFALNENEPNTISKHMVFAAGRPHALERATYLNRTGARAARTSVVARGEVMIASNERDGHTSETELDWQFDLPTFVALEVWLATQSRPPRSEHLAKGPDFERLRLVQRTYRVVEHNEQGYLVETNAPFAATSTQLDAQQRPVRLSMAGLFDVTQASEAVSIDLHSLKRKTNYLFPLDQRLHDHHALATLKLAMDTSAELDLPTEYALTANGASGNGDPEEFRGEELRYPITHPDIQRLAQAALDREDAMTVPERLVDIAHAQLEYAEEEPAGSVIVALAERRGECTDFADLYTTLARAAGFAARTVYGLAYKDGSNPALMFHAWNEVHDGDGWRAVDPTWNQRSADATHLALSDAAAASMMRANNRDGVRFRVLGSSYGS